MYFEQPPSSRKNAARAAISNKVERHSHINTTKKKGKKITNVRYRLRNNLLIRHRHGDAVSVCFTACNCVHMGKDDGVTERLVGCAGSGRHLAHRCGERGAATCQWSKVFVRTAGKDSVARVVLASVRWLVRACSRRRHDWQSVGHSVKVKGLCG